MLITMSIWSSGRTRPSHSGLRRTIQKRIDDREPADAAAVLHVFAEQGVAARFDRAGDDQRVVKRQLMFPGKPPRRMVEVECQRQRRIDMVSTSATASSISCQSSVACAATRL